MKCRRLSPSFGATRSLSHSQSETLRLSSAWSVQSFTIARFALPMAVATRGPEMISGRRPGPGLAWPPALSDFTRQGAGSRIQVAKLRLDLPVGRLRLEPVSGSSAAVTVLVPPA